MIPKTRKEAFKVLELQENASAEEIKKVYRKLILKWHPDKQSDESQEKQDRATEKSKEITVAYGILTDEIKEEFIKQQHNDDWADDWCKKFRKDMYGLHLSEEEYNLFETFYKQDLTKTKLLLERVQNINAQTKFLDISSKSILHYIVENSCNNPDWIEFLEEVLSKYSANNSTQAINVNIISRLQGTPLTIACRLGNLNVVNVLLKHGADPNVRVYSTYPPLYYALKENKIDIAKVLLEHGAETEEPGFLTEFSKSTVEILLPYASNRQKSRMLKSIAYSDHEETDHDIEIAELLLNAGVDDSSIRYANQKKKSKLIKLFTEHKGNVINNNSHSSGRRWTIVPAVLFCAIGATLAAMGIIPEIAAIGVIATVVLSGIAGAIVGGVAGYLVDVAINQYTVNQQHAAQ